MRKRATGPLLLLGVSAVAVLVRVLGAQRILTQIVALGSVLPLVLLITAGKYPLQTAAWRLALPASRRPPWWRSLAATLAGDTVGYLTFAGPVTGEPARALLLRDYLPISVGIAVGAFERAVYTVTGSIVVFAAVILAAARVNHAARASAAVAGVVAAIGLAAAVFARRRKAAESAAHANQPWRAVLDDLWRTRRGAVALIAVFGLLEHALLALEAGVVLRALGATPTLALVIMFEGLTKTLNSIGSVVPGRLGISEGGSTLLAGSLGVGASLGLSLALMRRARALLWSVAGLVTLLVLGVSWRQAFAGAPSSDDRHDARLAHGDEMSSRIATARGVDRRRP